MLLIGENDRFVVEKKSRHSIDTALLFDGDTLSLSQLECVCVCVREVYLVSHEPWFPQSRCVNFVHSCEWLVQMHNNNMLAKETKQQQQQQQRTEYARPYQCRLN